MAKSVNFSNKGGEIRIGSVVIQAGSGSLSDSDYKKIKAHAVNGVCYVDLLVESGRLFFYDAEALPKVETLAESDEVSEAESLEEETVEEVTEDTPAPKRAKREKKAPSKL